VETGVASIPTWKLVEVTVVGTVVILVENDKPNICIIVAVELDGIDVMETLVMLIAGFVLVAPNGCNTSVLYPRIEFKEATSGLHTGSELSTKVIVILWAGVTGEGLPDPGTY
jgi:hypothetical protein